MIIIAIVSGVIFGAGLAISGMLDPSKVSGFLDLFGVWDPSLAFVMGGGVIVNGIGFLLIKNRAKPLFATDFKMPTSKVIDKPLLIGSAEKCICELCDIDASEFQGAIATARYCVGDCRCRRPNARLFPE